VKSGPAAIESDSVALRVPVTAGDVALNTSDCVPAGVPAATLTVSGCDAPGASVNVAGAMVIPGTAGAITFTVPEKPLSGVIVACVLPDEPACTVIAGGLRLRTKSGARLTVTCTLALCVIPPDVNVNVTG